MDTYTLLAKISPQDDVVSDGAECPKCGEPRIDWLVWNEAGDKVRCATCGAQYALDQQPRQRGRKGRRCST